MKKYIPIISIITTILFSCNQSTVSDIEVIKFNPKTIDSLKQASDSVYTKILKGWDWHSADYYITVKDSIINTIYKDSSENVAAFTEQKNGVTIFAAEYYPNGQLKGKAQLKDGEINGLATYYYPDGRIKEIGEYSNDKETGTWKAYNEKGELQKTTHYDNDGNIIETN
jgi:antitoxin component YwqK of YwqJK toxin-antitoxin module